MNRVIIAIVISLLAGFSLAAWYQSSAPGVGESAVGDFDASADVLDRLLALETALVAEREARQLLEDELLALYEALDGLEDDDESDFAVGSASATVADARQGSDVLRVPPAANLRRGDNERRLQRMVDGGFSEARAEWILTRESELEMQAMQARYEAMRAGTPRSALDPALRPEQMLRAEIGDEEYERFLEANDRPTAVAIERIMEASPALAAGLRRGDRITHYDGERVFDTVELTRQTMQGEAGDSVIVNVVRDGVPMQIVMPRGPLGIWAGRGR